MRLMHFKGGFVLSTAAVLVCAGHLPHAAFAEGCIADGWSCGSSADCCSEQCLGEGVCATSSSSCADTNDDTWSFELNCAWVAEDPGSRCGIIPGATQACKAACGTPCPSASPTGVPSASPTEGPSTSPTLSPSDSPTANPTGAPTSSPTGVPTSSPSTAPTTDAPSLGPTTAAPVVPPDFVALSCPDEGDSMDVGLANGGTLEVDLSTAGTLVTLTLTESDPNDPTTDVQLIPIGRSYDGRPWEQVAGPYSDAVFGLAAGGTPPNCTSSSFCTITLPPEPLHSRYVLRTYSHSLDATDQLARFLDTLTFGVKSTDLLEGHASSYGENWRANYVRDQMDQPMTSHRVFWRVRTNPKITHSIGAGLTDGPCDIKSRWRKYAFIKHDLEDAIVDKRKTVRFYTPAEDENLPEPEIYEAEDAILVVPEGLTPLKETGNGETNGFFGNCQGDCDSDVDCASGLVCYQRGAFEAVPGCYGHGIKGWDYCIDVNALVGGNALSVSGNPVEPFPGPACLGDCDNDNECEGEFRCWQRWGSVNLPVPGCSGHNDPAISPNDDFCYDPKTSWTQPPYMGYEIDWTPDSGYTGENYLRHSTDSTVGRDKSWVEWTITVPTAGVYPLSFRYANGRKEVDYGQLSIEVSVNDVVEDEVLTPYSLGWNDWRYTKYVNANLNEGSNKIKLRNMQKYGAHIDHLRVGRAKSTIIEVDGHYRTVIPDRVRYTEGVDSNDDGQQILYSDKTTEQYHDYEICTFPNFYNHVYNEGRLRIRPKGDSGCGSSQEIDTLNPLVDFTGYENYLPSTFLDLSAMPNIHWSNAVADVEDSSKLIPGFDFFLESEINGMCSEFPSAAEEGDKPIFAKLSDGTYLQWTGVLNLEDNTADSPIADGGASALSDTNNVRCSNAPRNFINEEGCQLSYSACPYDNRESNGGATVVCGSIGEVANDHAFGHLFHVEHEMEDTVGDSDLEQQKTKVWTHIALDSSDQLRQRMAWALSQIYTVVQGGIPNDELTEVYLNYYDIHVRHAFGNLRDILREVSYSPLMAYHLTYRGSKSAAFIYDEDGKIIMPDENYARELMQLFTIGLEKLNDDGTLQRDAGGRPIPTYTNEDIMSFARAWTGFQAHRVRGNYEQPYKKWDYNLLDPLYIEENWRDRFPKHDLTGGYIGDTYPLCVDMPDRAFLHKGAKYRVLGNNPLPELMKDHPDLMDVNNTDIKRMVLSTSSNLYAALNNGGNYQAVVKLADNLQCVGSECNVNTVRVVQVDDIFYEYVPLPCVHQAFFEGGKQIARGRRDWEGVMCADPRLPAASEACGNQEIQQTVKAAYQFSEYTRERVTYNKAESRCMSQKSQLPEKTLFDLGDELTEYGHCEGDCDNDADCEGNLVCFGRNGHENVPGCSQVVEQYEVTQLDDTIGNNAATIDNPSPYGFCQGDCDKDSDCQGNLVCFQRNDHTEVPPGCNNTAESFDPIPLNSTGNNYGFNAYGLCQGDCDSDSDCGEGLYCFQRDAFEDVPGCDMSGGTGISGWDYCAPSQYLGQKDWDYCVQPEYHGRKGWDFCVDPLYDSGLFKFSRVSGEDYDLGYHWTTFDCSIQAKINNEGYVALVHETDNMNTIPPHLNSEHTLNYFKVLWEGDVYPSPGTGCGNCKESNDACICPTRVVDETAFDSEPASANDILSNLYIGAVPPDVAGSSDTFTSQTPTDKDFTVHFPQGSGAAYNADTIFELNHPYHGTKLFLKNTKSTVQLEGWSSPSTILEAEEANVGGDSVPQLTLSNETSRSRFTGTGYMTFASNVPGYLSWIVNVPETTQTPVTATLSFRYENSYGQSKMADVFVNNGPAYPAKFGSTGNWDYWFYSDEIQVELTPGDNIIRMEYSFPSNDLRIDNLKIDWPTVETAYSFRNPVHFMSLSQDYGDDGDGETTARDAAYETDAVLDHLFQHENTAPFICIRLIQRFFNSNPSPGHIKSCAAAFRTGFYTSSTETFGSGEYGDLASTVAAILLEPEATSVALDSDPSHGRIREPFLQPIQMLRSLDAVLKPHEHHFELWELFDRLGEEPHHFETVFSFFLPEYVPDAGPNIKIGYVAPEAMRINMPSIVAQLNGLTGLVKYGVSDCFESSGVRLGFGRSPGFGNCLDNGSMQRATSFLSYSPKATTSADLIKELNTLLCAGRLSQSRQNEIAAAYDAYSPSYDETQAKIRFAYQLIISTPEFHTNTIVTENPTASRPAASSSSSSTNEANGYKATILLFFDGGMDSFSMIPPHTCANDLYDKYVDIRGGLSTAVDPGVALPKDSLWQIHTNNTDHVCSIVGLHKKLPFLKDLYDMEEAIFVTNTGLMDRPVTKEDYRDTNVQLFSHNSMQKETKRVDLEYKEIGTGVLGRLRDGLSNAGLTSQSFSIVGSQVSLCGKPGVTEGAITLSSDGLQSLLPRYESSSYPEGDLTPDLVPHIMGLNNASALDSSFFAETWSAKVTSAIIQHQELYDALEAVTLIGGNFVNSDGSRSSLCKQLEMTVKVMATRGLRGVERDLFHIGIGGWDMHSDVINSLETKFEDVNSCLSAFVSELRTQGLWEQTVLLQFSEFGRTLNPNSGPNGDNTNKGVDHAWGGNQFTIGGGLKGGKVLGQYPLDFTEEGPLALSRGRIIPTTPWDALWSGVAPWMGVQGEDMDYVLPMRSNFPPSSLFSEEMMFE